MTITATLTRLRRPSSGSAGGGETTAPYLARLDLTGPSTVIATHQTLAFSLVAYDQNGLVFVGAPGPYTYASSDSTKATIDPVSGVATGLTTGTTNITVSAMNSLGATVRSNAVTLTVQAQVATSPIALSPPSTTLASGTQQFTAVVSDQAAIPNVISGAVVTWDTDNHAVATVDSAGLLTAVGNGTCTLTATSGSATGTATVTVAASSVTAVTAYYNTAVATQLLMRTGTAYVFTAKDQAGNVLSGVGVWSTSDGTNFPINANTGSLTPAVGAAGKGVTVTYTHTATQHTTTFKATALLPSTPLLSDSGENYTGNTGTGGFMNNVSHYIYDNSPSTAVNTTYNSNVPTGPYPQSTYIDGLKVNQITWDNTPSRQFMGNPVLNVAIPTGGGAPQLIAWLGQNYATRLTRAWCLVIRRFDPGFTDNGNGQGGAAAYKNTPWFFWPPGQSGRCGTEYTNGTGIDLGNDFNSPTTAGSTTRIIGNVVNEWTDGLYYADVLLFEHRSYGVQSCRAWLFQVGADVGTWLKNAGGPGSPTGLVEGGVNPPGNLPQLATSVCPLGANYNRGVPVPGYNKQVAYWEVVDGTAYGDPFGIAGTQATPTTTGVTNGTLTTSSTQQVVTIAGTGYNDWCYPVFSASPGVAPSWLGDGVSPIVRTGSTQFQITVDVLSTATPGVGTVAIYNAASQVTSNPQTFTIQALAAPGAPTASNATAVNNNTLTFPVTLNASGTLPSALAWQYRVTGSGSGFTVGTDLALAGPSLGQVTNQSVVLPAASTGYDVQFAERNNGGTSAFSSTVTGATGAAASLISANLTLDLNADAGLDVSTDGAAVGSQTDQSATAGLYLQGTPSKKPTLKTNVVNGHNVVRYTSANSTNLTTASTISAYNSADVTLYVVAKVRNDNPSAPQRLFENFVTNGGAAYQGHIFSRGQGATDVVFAYGDGSSTPPVVLTFSTSITVASGFHCFAAVVNHTTPLVTIYLDGLAVATSSTRPYVAPVTNPGIVSMGSENGSAAFGDFDVARILQYSSVHSSAQVAQNYAFLKALYALP